MSEQTTSDRITVAAIELISQKGYKSATTKAIAQLANVNEVTLFRHFGNKRGLLKAIVQKFSYAPLLQQVIQEQVTWDLKDDLLLFSTEYQRYIMSIKDFVMIGMKEADLFPEINEEIAMYKTSFSSTEIMNYLSEMQKRGNLVDVNIEATAMALIHLNFGHFMSLARLGVNVSEITTEDQLKTNIFIFSRGLTP